MAAMALRPKSEKDMIEWCVVSIVNQSNDKRFCQGAWIGFGRVSVLVLHRRVAERQCHGSDVIK